MGVFLPTPKFWRVRFRGSSYIDHPMQIGTLFEPTTGPRPPEGWPCLIAADHSGFHSSWWYDAITDSTTLINGPFYYALLEAGYAVFQFCPAVARSPSTPDDATYRNDHTHASLNMSSITPGANEYDVAYAGNGIWHSPYQEMPADFTGDQHPYEDNDWPMATKDAVAALQYVIANAGAMHVDTTKLVAFGNSAGAVVQSWTLLGEERRAQTWGPGASGQEDIKTRGAYACGIIQNFPWHYPMFDQTLGGPDWKPWHLATPGTADQKFDNYDRGAFQLDNATNQGVASDVQVSGSMSDWTTKTAALIAANKTVPIWMSHEDNDEDGPPYNTTNTGGTLTLAHGAWSGVAFCQQFNEGQIRWVANATVEASIDASVTDPLHLPTVVADANQIDDAVSWLNTTLDYTHPYTGALDMSGTPTSSVEVFTKSEGIWAQATSTGNDDPKLLFAANPDRKFVDVWNIGLILGRVQESDSVSHTGLPLHGALQYSGVTGSQLGGYHQRFEGTEAIYVRANAAPTVSCVFLGREV